MFPAYSPGYSAAAASFIPLERETLLLEQKLAMCGGGGYSPAPYYESPVPVVPLGPQSSPMVLMSPLIGTEITGGDYGHDAVDHINHALDALERSRIFAPAGALQPQPAPLAVTAPTVADAALELKLKYSATSIVGPKSSGMVGSASRKKVPSRPWLSHSHTNQTAP